MSDRVRSILTWVVTLGLTAVVIGGLIVGEETQTDRVQAIGSRIKCPVCQGESIMESPSETATAMMDIITERVTDGQSDSQIIDYFTERYGDGILLDPRFEARTMLLWLVPAAALVGGGLMIWSRRRKPEEASS